LFCFVLFFNSFLAVPISSFGVCGVLDIADPLDACSQLQIGVQSNEAKQKRFALIIRGGCAFEDKVRNAQNAGFGAAIVYDDRDKGKLVYSESHCPFETLFIASFVISWINIYTVCYFLLLKDYLVFEMHKYMGFSL
jgi:hypothetical protein